MVASVSTPASPTLSPSSAPRQSGKWRKAMRVALTALVLFGILLGACALVVPYVIKTTAPNWLKEKTGRILVVRDAAFNPLTLRLRVDDAALSDAGKPLARFNTLEIKGSWASLTQLAWTAESITLVQPEISARIAADGSLDWVRFLDSFPKDTAPTPPSDNVPRILLHNISVTNADVRVTDERTGASEKRLELAPLTFTLDKLSTLPRDRGDYALQATLNDQTRVQWKGRVGLNPVESSGDIVVTNLPLTRVQSIANLQLPVGIGGTANFRTNYSATAGTDFVATGIGDGVLEVNDLRATQGKDEASAKSIKLSPLSASWAKTKADGRDQQVFALLPLTAVIQGLSVKANGQTEPLLSAAQVTTVKPVTVDLNARTVEVPQIAITGLQGNVLRDKSGRLLLPFAGLSASNATPKPAAQAVVTNPTPDEKGWRINMAEVATDKANLALRDQSFAVPQTVAAKLDLTLGATIATGDKQSVIVSSKRVALSDVAMRDDAATTAWLIVKEIRALPVELDVLGSKIDLPKIEVVAPFVNLTLDKDGIDVARKLAPAVATSAAPVAPVRPTPSTATAATQKISVAGVSVNGGRVSLTDSTLPSALTHVVDAIRINADRIEIDGSRPLSASANATLASGGALQAKLKFDQKRNDGEAEFRLEKVALATLSPYLNRNTKLKLSKGEAVVAGRAKFSAATTAEEALRFDGTMAVSELELIDETTQAPFAQWAELSSQDVKVAMGKNGLDVELVDLLLDQPRGKLIIAENSTINLTQIGKTDASGAPMPAVQSVKPAQTAPVPADGKKAVRVKVDRLQVTGGDVEFADLSLRPQFGTRVSDLSGLIVGLSTEPSSRAEVSLEGKVDEFGLARVSGNLSPLGATEYTDIKAIFRNVEMKNLTPYSGKFAGRKIESGKLSLDLEYKIDQRKLKGENKVVVDNLVLGDRIESKDATNLPLDLAIALLRDSNGMIELGLPVQGSLDDPQFSFGGLVWKVIVNVLTKIATSPFRALGALLGGSGEEFEAVNFEPGEARLLPPEREKLAKLAKALEQRPQLKLEVVGRFDKTRDREALADNILKLEISKRAGMKPPGANEPLIISFTDAKVQAALDELATAAGDDATKLRAQYLPPASNAVFGALQNARERLTEKGRTEAADARGKYYPALFKLMHTKQAVPDTAYATLASFRAGVIKTTLTAVNKFDAARVSVAASQPVKSSTPDQVATTLALSVK